MAPRRLVDRDDQPTDRRGQCAGSWSGPPSTADSTWERQGRPGEVCKLSLERCIGAPQMDEGEAPRLTEQHVQRTEGRKRSGGSGMRVE